MNSIKAQCNCGKSMDVATYYADNEIYSVIVECTKCNVKVTIDFPDDDSLPIRLEGSE